MSKAIIVPDLAYTSRAGRRGGNSNGYKELKAKLKYFQFRNDRDGHIPQERGLERWHDHGLGRNYGDIMRNCDRLGAEKVLAWTWVISPAPDLMALVPANQREPLLITLTEQVVEAYYEARDADVSEFSFVVHDRLTRPDERTGERLQQLHTHVVLAGTVPGLAGDREPFYNRSTKGHIELLQELSNEKLSLELDRAIGPDWRRLRPELERPVEKPAQALSHSQAISQNGASELDHWFGPQAPEIDR